VYPGRHHYEGMHFSKPGTVVGTVNRMSQLWVQNVSFHLKQSLEENGVLGLKKPVRVLCQNFEIVLVTSLNDNLKTS
jgi:hypothetical protein